MQEDNPSHVKNIETLNLEAVSTRNLKKISGPLGSIEGGWYHDEETGIECYLKFYQKEITPKLEYFANLVYQKLGIYVPQKKLDIMDDRLVILSKKIGRGERATKEEQKGHPDLMSGFVADAYLNNWDVVGEFFDNIVKDESGHLYRVDNGGIGPVRANEGRKNFNADAIPELDDMRNPKFQAGCIFEGVTSDEIKIQAQKFIENVSEEFLGNTLLALKLEENDKNEVLEGFLSRRFYLKDKYANIAA